MMANYDNLQLAGNFTGNLASVSGSLTERFIY